MAHNDYKEGWGVVDAEGLNIRTVSDTRRAAIINWLVTRGVNIWSHYDDERIERIWGEMCGDAMVRPVRCHVY